MSAERLTIVRDVRVIFICIFFRSVIAWLVQNIILIIVPDIEREFNYYCCRSIDRDCILRSGGLLKFGPQVYYQRTKPRLSVRKVPSYTFLSFFFFLSLLYCTFGILQSKESVDGAPYHTQW